MSWSFTSERFFQVWRYSPSHRFLLLRSARTDSFATRIDIVFGGVGRMLLEPEYDGLRIRTATETERQTIQETVGGIPMSGGLYLLESGSLGFIASSEPAWHEDTGAYNEPSQFDSMFML